MRPDSSPMYCLSTVFGLVDVDYALGRELRQRGFEVRWIVSRRESADELVQRGADRASILSVAVKRSEVSKSLATAKPIAIAQSLTSVLGSSGDPYRFLLVDRFATRWDGVERFHYAGLLADRIYAAVSGASHFVIVGEPSSLTDWFLHLYARERRELFCSLHSVRYPSGRIGCFAGVDDSTLLPLSLDPATIGVTTVDSMREGRPEYFDLDAGNMARRNPSEWLARIRQLYRNSDEAADFSLAERTLRRLRIGANRLYLTRVFQFDDVATSRPYVLFPLQVQPEMVIDVANPEFRDQLHAIRVLRRLLPPSYALYVKEHHSQLGCRGRGFYEGLRGIPDVQVLPPTLDGKELARGAGCVVSVSGTMLLEAAMYGVRAIALSRLFFSVHDLVRTASNVDELETELKELPIQTPDPEVVRAANQKYLEWALARSRRAVYGEAAYYPDVLRPENIRALADVLCDATSGWHDRHHRVGRDELAKKTSASLPSRPSSVP